MYDDAYMVTYLDGYVYVYIIEYVCANVSCICI